MRLEIGISTTTDIKHCNIKGGQPRRLSVTARPGLVVLVALV